MTCKTKHMFMVAGKLIYMVFNLRKADNIPKILPNITTKIQMNLPTDNAMDSEIKTVFVVNPVC